jgi:Flp pilus assembly pilin Flp
MKQVATSFWRDENGSTAIEYGLLVGFLGGGLIITLLLIPETLSNTFDSLIEAFGL